jgi:acyl carrier protein
MPANDPSVSSDSPSSPNQENASPEFIAELSQLVIDALNLEMTVAEIDPDGSLFGEGLGLDSIDILEIALVVSKKYGFQLRSDDKQNEVIYRSMRNLATHVAANRSK